jgi:glycosyltransferase involved in cell wall biosynthesis
MYLSVVVPVYNERDNLEPLVAELVEALDAIGKPYEILAVDDGSRDGSTALLRDLVAKTARLKVLFLRRNAGQTAAFDAGFREATGEIVVTLDADRQNDPRDIAAMLDKLETEGLDMVTGWRRRREDGLFLRRVPSRIANALVRAVTGTTVHDLGCSLRVYRKSLVDELDLYGEMHRFISVIADGMGARIGEIVVNHRPRTAGVSKYGTRRVFKVMLDLTTVWFMRRYQSKPIYVFGGASAVMLALAAASAALVLWEKYAEGNWVHRNPMFLISILCVLVAVQFLGIGILAEIIVRIYFEQRGKRPYAIAARAGFEEGS